MINRTSRRDSGSTMSFRAGILTVSDKGARGERRDTSGEAIRERLKSAGGSVERYEVVPDEREKIGARLRAWADGGDLDLVFTTGGTGLTARDVTPEATLDVVERQVPGLVEAMRAAGLGHTPMAMLSRGVAGARGRCLIVNLPGSEKGVRESLEVILPVLSHAVEMLRGEAGDHVATAGGIERGATGTAGD
jgi:molybdopterin adenylyltransferase